VLGEGGAEEGQTVRGPASLEAGIAGWRVVGGDVQGG
jgi:hypothetical protein